MTTTPKTLGSRLGAACLALAGMLAGCTSPEAYRMQIEATDTE